MKAFRITSALLLYLVWMGLCNGSCFINTLSPENRYHLDCTGKDEIPQVENAKSVYKISITKCNGSLLALEKNDFAIYINLVELSIQECNVTSLDTDTFSLNKNLTILDFRHNQITEIHWKTIRTAPLLEKINVADNPLICDCAAVWLGVIHKKSTDFILSNPKCTFPNSTVTSVTSLAADMFSHCERPSGYVMPNVIHHLKPGDNVTVECHMTGRPSPQVEWDTSELKSNYSIHVTGNGSAILNIYNVSEDDNGLINCVGTNLMLFNQSSVRLQVDLPVRIIGNISIDELQFNPCLHYEISGTEPYNKTWYKDGHPVELGFFEDSGCEGKRDVDTECGCMRWTSSSGPGSSGQYRLHVTNAFGGDNSSVFVQSTGRAISVNLTPMTITQPRTTKGTTQIPARIQQNNYLLILLPLVGTLLMVAVFFTVFFYLKRRREGLLHKSKFNLSRSPLRSGDSDPNSPECTPLANIPGMMDNPNYHLHSKKPAQTMRIISPDKLSFIRELGEGAFGRVYLGSCKHLTSGDESTMVAIKTLKQVLNSEAQRDFEREAELMADIPHENIVSFYGICYSDESLMMIFEYMENGDLNNFLRSNGPDAAALGYETWNSTPFLLTELLHIAQQISAGMNFLASRHFVHRDLATRNCLVGEKLIVKIGDFGMSRDVYSTDYYKVGGQTMLPIRWMPPESILYRRFSVQSDVWSYGILLWEIFSYGMQPWFELSNAEVIEHIKAGKLLCKPDSCTDGIYKVMLGCWKPQPADRLTMEQVHLFICDALHSNTHYNNNISLPQNHIP